MSVHVFITATTPVDPDAAFARLADYERYPELTSTVLGVQLDRSGGQLRSAWRVTFRGGVLAWTEVDRVDPVARVLDFEQVDGDLDRFIGRWTVEPTVDGSRIAFTAEVDLGIPSLAPIVDPIADAALRENIRTILEGLFEGAVDVADGRAEPAVRAS